MTVLVGAGALALGLVVVALAFYVLWRFWPVFAALGFVASFVGIAGGIGHAVTHGAADDPPSWIFTCAVGGMVLAFFSLLVSNDGA